MVAVKLRIPESAVEDLDAIAQARGFVSRSGKPNRSDTVEVLAKEERKRIRELLEKAKKD